MCIRDSVLQGGGHQAPGHEPGAEQPHQVRRGGDARTSGTGIFPGREVRVCGCSRPRRRTEP
eukprot:12442761-Alexandrium_andersonii.AAC.1